MGKRRLAFWGILLLALALVIGACNNDTPPPEPPVEPGPPEPTETLSMTVVTWNVEAMFSTQDVANRSTDLQQLSQQLNPDIIVLQEFTSVEILEAIRDAMGFGTYHVACSDFNQNDNNTYNSLEVGVISRWPIGSITEYDQTPDNVPSEGDPAEVELTVPSGVPVEDIGVGRGYLWVDIPSQGLAVVAVHLKSSRGDVGTNDADNAKKRELVTASIATKVNEVMAANADYTCIVAGDFNVGHSDPLKVGVDLAQDCYDNCAGQDLYDETHALLQDGLVGGLHMSNLCDTITTSTYPSYPGFPIDNIYVVGKLKDQFRCAFKASSTYGSDHLPVVAIIGEGGGEPPPDTTSDDLYISAVLANGLGGQAEERQNEAVWLTNPTDADIDLTGWLLLDEANTIWDLTQDGQVGAGEVKKITRDGRPMGINNSGDKLDLVDPDGNVVDHVEFGPQDEGVVADFGG